jgi:hypothetical protein
MSTEQDSIKVAIRASRINVLIAGIAVLSGGMIYVLCRPLDYFFFQWIRSIGFDGALSFLRTHTLPDGSHLPEWIVYSLPDGLWAFAYTLIILTIWNGSNSILKYVWFATIPLLVLGVELLQWAGNIGGTFCFNDIILLITGLLAGMVTNIVTLNLSHYESSNEIQHFR